MKTLALALVAALVAVPAARAAIQTKEITYRQGETELQGYLAWDDAATGLRPGLVVVHEWWGHNAHARRQAERLAESGYVAFALDMYGKGKLATHPEDAKAFVAEATKDVQVLAARFNAALDVPKADPHVDNARLGAVGYCFGGAVALGMARRGADLGAVVTFHAALATDAPAQPGAVKARILVLTGADDPMIPADQVDAFKTEMQAAGAKARVISLPGARHSFTNPDADKSGVPGLAYDAKADKRSWREMEKFLREAWPAR